MRKVYYIRQLYAASTDADVATNAANKEMEGFQWQAASSFASARAVSGRRRIIIASSNSRYCLRCVHS